MDRFQRLISSLLLSLGLGAANRFKCLFFQLLVDRFETLAIGRNAALGTIIVGDDPGDVLVREGEHLRQKIVLIKVLHVVYGCQGLQVALRDTLDLAKDPLILDETCPELTIIVSTAFERRWIVDNL